MKNFTLAIGLIVSCSVLLAQNKSPKGGTFVFEKGEMQGFSIGLVAKDAESVYTVLKDQFEAVTTIEDLKKERIYKEVTYKKIKDQKLWVAARYEKGKKGEGLLLTSFKVAGKVVTVDDKAHYPAIQDLLEMVKVTASKEFMSPIVNKQYKTYKIIEDQLKETKRVIKELEGSQKDVSSQIASIEKNVSANAISANKNSRAIAGNASGDAKVIKDLAKTKEAIEKEKLKLKKEMDKTQKKASTLKKKLKKQEAKQRKVEKKLKKSKTKLDHWEALCKKYNVNKWW